MALLADFGGFNDGLLLLVSAITGIYSESMFQGKFASMLPVHNKLNKKKRQSQRKRDQTFLDETKSKLEQDMDVQINQ